MEIGPIIKCKRMFEDDSESDNYSHDNKRKKYEEYGMEIEQASCQDESIEYIFPSTKCRNCHRHSHILFHPFKYYTTYTVCMPCYDKIHELRLMPERMGLGPLFGSE